MSTSRERSPSTRDFSLVWDQVQSYLWDMDKFLDKYRYQHQIQYIYGVPRGGLIPAIFLSHTQNLKFVPDHITLENLDPKRVIVVEDVVDTGASTRLYSPHYPIMSIVRKSWAPEILFAALETDGWVKFPWENGRPGSRSS